MGPLPTSVWLPTSPCLCHVLLQFRQTLESVVRNGSSSPKLAALVQTLRQHYQVPLWICLPDTSV